MEQIWEKVKQVIRGKLPSHSYLMWIDPLVAREGKEGEWVLVCPNFFSKKRIHDHFGALIESEIQKATGRACRIQYEIGDRNPEKRSQETDWGKPDRQLSLPHLNIHPPAGRLLRKGFTFDRFVVSDNNHFAYSAAFAMASQKASDQNSLFLLSDTGMGKSHLSQAIGHHIVTSSPLESVCYVTAEDFTNEMVHAIRNDAIDAFKGKYRNQCDVLILEDVHFLTGKERTQIELALSLDYLMDANKKLIFTSCYLPGNIPKLNDQLRSRLTCSLIPNIDPPDYKTRVKILKKKAAENDYCIPDGVIDFLAGELDENIRQLESGLIGVTAKSSLLGMPIDMKLAESVIKNITRPKKKISIDIIKKLVCDHYRISPEEIASASRKQSVVRPRHIAIYLAKKYTDRTLQEIGRSFNRYHATALRSISTVKRGVEQDSALRKQVEFFCDKLESGEY